MSRLFITVLLAGVFQVGTAFGQDWPQWRGPFFNGSTEATDLPRQWSRTENVKWILPMPGPGASTPIVAGDRLFLTSFDTRSRHVWALAVDRHSGRILWKHPLGYGQKARMRGRENHLAGPSAACDGRRVVFQAGNGQVLMCDLEGKVLWRMDLVERFGTLTILWDFASSPLLMDGRVYINVIRRDHDGRNPRDKGYQGYLLCLEAATGRQIFHHIRPTDARLESQEAYTTPIPLEAGGRKSILVLGGDYLTAHDPDTGAERWRVGGWNSQGRTLYRIVPSVVVAGSILVVCAPQGQPVYGFRLDPTDPHGRPPKLAWKLEQTTADAPTPLFYKGRLYILNDKKGRLDCYDPATGREIWSGQVPDGMAMRASPTGGDGRVFVVDGHGTTYCFAAGDRFRLLHKAELGGYPTYASIALAHGHLFVRTAEKLYCIGR